MTDIKRATQRRGKTEKGVRSIGKLARAVLRAALRSIQSRWVLVCALFMSFYGAEAQTIDTNAPTVLTTVVAGNYNTAAALGIGIAVVGLIVWAVYKGLLLKKR